jgi:broad specificity phosphatase PhoE
MIETTLGLLRHGQTDWNIDLRLQGTADIPMNAFGIAQVESAASALSQHGWDLVLSSPLGRAKQSAEIVSKFLGIERINIEPLLLERSFGIGEGLTYAEWGEKYAKLDEIPGAESANDVARRSRLLLEHIKAEFQGAKVLAVSHGALIRFVLAEVTEGKVPPPGERLQNASLHTLRHKETWTLDAWAPQPLGSQLPN